MLAWLLVEQVPIWVAPPPPWERYPELAAVPGGCVAADALRLFHAERMPKVTAALSDYHDIERATVALIAEHYPEIDMAFVLAPELVSGSFDKGSAAWFSLVSFETGRAFSQAGAVAFVSAAAGDLEALIHIPSMQPTGECGSFAPQPAGLRARLRPFLPLIALLGYVGAVGIGWMIVRLRPPRRTRKDTS
jgi:hypothetical protein